MSNIIQFPDRLVVALQVRQAALVDYKTVAPVAPVAQPATFEVGKEYTCTSVCDSGCVYRYTVINRSAKFVTLKYYNETHRRRIQLDDDGNEYCLPDGSYSMAPILRAK